ncbi:type III-B CRISPR module-associated protein Cmr3 [Thermus sp.]|uniref:type III-B CRISPR module-associated protein Cmr3 n=1 Tax=Thermus sp. TaxID=275 RepID=UPI00307D5009
MLIEPRDPLIARDGRPFSAHPGAQAKSLPFPLPQTLAGAYRRRRAEALGLSFPEAAEAVKAWPIRGPLLAEEDGGRFRLLGPRPLDAVRLGERLLRLLPWEAEGGTNLPQGLLPLAPEDLEARGKPGPLLPFWYWEALEAWLLGQAPQPLLEHPGPAREVRFHVGLDPTHGVAREGFLFRTEGLEFAHKDCKEEGRPRTLALVLWVEEEVEGVFPLGGERRLAFWRKGGPGVPKPPEGLLEALLRHRAARALLLTPALFAEGWRPRGGEIRGARVVAAAVGRPLWVSGWDLQAGRPKPTRRAVPAGSVYFLRLPKEWGEAEIRGWLEAVWFQNASDEEQDRRDGFGLLAIGVWDGGVLSWR